MQESGSKPSFDEENKRRMCMRGYAHRPVAPERFAPLSSAHRSSFIVDRSLPAFTLTELLIVIGIIVLFITLALPAFNLISGSKSIAGAENEISAMLGRARAEAIGVQDYRGLAIYRDAATDRYCGAIVSFVPYTSWNAGAAYPQYAYVSYATAGNPTQYYVSSLAITASTSNANPPPYPGPYPPGSPPQWYECAPGALDIEGSTDVQDFPAGVGVQVVNNWPASNSTAGSAYARGSNGYLPMGVILFNGQGVMTAASNVKINFATHGQLGTIATFAAYATSTTNNLSIPNYVDPVSFGATNNGLPLYPSFGLVVFDKQTFEGQNFYSGLPSQLKSILNVGTSINADYINNYPGEQAADKWLDANATPLMINRYNGTLIRSE